MAGQRREPLRGPHWAGGRHDLLLAGAGPQCPGGHLREWFTDGLLVVHDQGAVGRFEGSVNMQEGTGTTRAFRD